MFLVWVVFFNNFINISLSFDYSIKALESFKCLNPVLFPLLIKNWYFTSYGSLTYKLNLSISACWLNNNFSFITSSKLIIFVSFDYIVTFNCFFSHIRSLFVPFAHVSIESVDCILSLSSLISFFLSSPPY